MNGRAAIPTHNYYCNSYFHYFMRRFSSFVLSGITFFFFLLYSTLLRIEGNCVHRSSCMAGRATQQEWKLFWWPSVEYDNTDISFSLSHFKMVQCVIWESWEYKESSFSLVYIAVSRKFTESTGIFCAIAEHWILFGICNLQTIEHTRDIKKNAVRKILYYFEFKLNNTLFLHFDCGEFITYLYSDQCEIYNRDIIGSVECLSLTWLEQTDNANCTSRSLWIIESLIISWL